MLTEKEKKLYTGVCYKYFNALVNATNDLCTKKYKDQDGYDHKIFIREDFMDTEKELKFKQQLFKLHDNFFGIGNETSTRMKLYYKKCDRHNEVSYLTIASIIQVLRFNPSDMRLMSDILTWLYE